MQWISPFWAGARRLVSKVDLRALADAAGGWRALQDAGPVGLLELGVPEGVVDQWLRRGPESTMGTALTLIDPRYPPLIAALPDAPPVLCVDGSVEALSEPGVAIVGTRTCTPYGIAVARHLGIALAARGLVVVSGLARGIDGHAHRAAVSVGRTTAVLGHGLAHTSPTSHRDLRRRIIQEGGAVMTAFPDDLRPARWTFPSRNRWIAALARAVIVVEAPLKSGALISAAEAADLDRDLYAVPAALGRPSSAGCLQLLSAGAMPVFDVEALADELAERWVERASQRPDSLSGLESMLIGGSTPAQLAERLGEPLAEVLARLAVLEVQGRVARLPGQIYVPHGARHV